MQKAMIMKWIVVFVAVAGGSRCLLADGVSPAGTNKTDRIWQAMLTAESPHVLSNILSQCRQLTWPEQSEILVNCQRHLSKEDQLLPYSGGLLNGYDVSRRSGRSVWLASQLLETSLPSLGETATPEDTSNGIMAITKAMNAIDAKRYQKELEKLAYCLQLPLKERLALAQSEKTDYSVLDVLAKDSDVNVRKAVANNYSTLFETVITMQENDPDDSVRKATVENSLRARTLRMSFKRGFIPKKPTEPE